MRKEPQQWGGRHARRGLVGQVQSRPPQKQTRQPGIESRMKPRPISENPEYRGSGKLRDQVAVITGGDSGIGRAVAIAFAKEGAKIAIVYLNEHDDAEDTVQRVKEFGVPCVAYAGDIGNEKTCTDVVRNVTDVYGHIDILVNNAAEQHEHETIEEITAKELERTFRTNIFSYFFMTKAALPHMKKGGRIINCSSVTAYRGSPKLLDYSSTKGAIVSFTRSLAKSLVEKGIRVNGVAPGPVWTPLIPASFQSKKVAKFGLKSPMKRAAEPDEIAPSFVFLASSDSSFMSGQFLHPNGGEIVNT
jgi:NAD(P)-dependent dehydrogenase (short-subunit alcohol dehydrogenase family)